jgi:hypothetical protein
MSHTPFQVQILRQKVQCSLFRHAAPGDSACVPLDRGHGVRSTAGAAEDRGRRAVGLAAGHRGAKRVMPPNAGTKKLSLGAPAPRACRVRVAILAKNDATRRAAPRKSGAQRRPPPLAHPHPPAAVAASDHGRWPPGLTDGCRARGDRIRARQTAACALPPGPRRPAGGRGGRRGWEAAVPLGLTKHQAPQGAINPCRPE